MGYAVERKSEVGSRRSERLLAIRLQTLTSDFKLLSGMMNIGVRPTVGGIGA